MTTKSTRLTNDLRDRIISKIVDDNYKEKKNLLKEKRYAFSEKVYNDVYSKSQREKMMSLPSGWLPELNEFYVQFGQSPSGYCQRQLKEAKRFPHSARGNYGRGACLKVYDQEHKFTIEHDKLTKQVDALKEEYRETLREVKAMVYSCNTTKQLKEAWPEVASFVEPYEPVEGRSTEVAPIMDKINERLGLSKTKK